MADGSENVAVEHLTVSAYTIPTDSPEADGTAAWTETTLVLVTIRSHGTLGLGYTYADLSTAQLIHSKLQPIVHGQDAFDIAALGVPMERAVRNLGRPGIASMAISAVDVALWDLKAKLLGQPLVKLLGAARKTVPVYGSGGFTTYSARQLREQLGG